MSEHEGEQTEKQSIKCVVWDLDGTLWDGILLEDERVALRDNVVGVIKTLDGRGIVHAIASRNDPERALAQIEAFDLREYFLCAEIGWGSKAASIERIAKTLNLGLDAIAFVDDQPFEREDVRFSLPQVLCFDAIDVDALPARPELSPRFVTDDSRQRRRMYQCDLRRRQAEDTFEGSSDEFLTTLEMRFTITRAAVGDLQRAEELTIRTHQLNTTGYTYSFEELDALLRSDDHLVLLASLEDRFGSYGKIGLCLIEKRGDGAWIIKLLLMSCRVMSRGVGAIFINRVLSMAREAGVSLYAEFLPTSRNRAMYITYKMSGFKDVDKAGEIILMRHDLSRVPPPPNYLRVSVDA